jgi:hypothetical protein
MGIPGGLSQRNNHHQNRSQFERDTYFPRLNLIQVAATTQSAHSIPCSLLGINQQPIDQRKEKQQNK